MRIGTVEINSQLALAPMAGGLPRAVRVPRRGADLHGARELEGAVLSG